MSDDSLAKQVFNEQIQNEWPGLTKEVKNICYEWCVRDVTKKWQSEPKANEWKEVLKKAAHVQNSKSLLKKMMKMSKLEEYIDSEEEYEIKDYVKDLNMHDARVNFKLRSKMFPCKDNFRSDPVNVASKWLCKACEVVDSQSHILTCPAYQQLREGKSLDSEKDVIEYYRKVMVIRSKLNIDQ